MPSEWSATGVSEREHKRALRFDFKEERNTAVFVCDRVRQGAPVLYVSHESDGDWQFLCGGSHGDLSEDPGCLRCLECVVADDLTLNELADLGGNWSAERETWGGPWRRHDRGEAFIVEAVQEYGWAVELIEAGEGEAEPAFAYTVGLYQSFGAPELIVFGLAQEVMHEMLNTCGERIKAGETLPVDEPFAGVLEDYAVKLRRVHAPESFREHVGYAIWFNDGKPFPLLQLVWPDKAGRFPGEPGVNPSLAKLQPLLP